MRAKEGHSVDNLPNPINPDRDINYDGAFRVTSILQKLYSISCKPSKHMLSISFSGIEQTQESMFASSCPSSCCFFKRLQNGLLLRIAGPHLMNTNGIGDKAKHKKPNRLQAQPIPRFSYSGYVARGNSSAAAMLRLNTDEASAEAE